MRWYDLIIFKKKICGQDKLETIEGLVLCMVMVLFFLSGCALSTIEPYRAKKAAEPPKKSLIEKITEPIVKPAPVVEKEEEIK